MTLSAGLADRVVSGIKDQILSGDLAPGGHPIESRMQESARRETNPRMGDLEEP